MGTPYQGARGANPVWQDHRGIGPPPRNPRRAHFTRCLPPTSVVATSCLCPLNSGTWSAGSISARPLRQNPLEHPSPGRRLFHASFQTPSSGRGLEIVLTEIGGCRPPSSGRGSKTHPHRERGAAPPRREVS